MIDCYSAYDCYNVRLITMLIAMNKILRTVSYARTNHRANMARMESKVSSTCSKILCGGRFYQLFSTSSTETSINVNINVNKNKRDSHWIYSTKHEEQLYRKEGKISLYSNIGRDTHNASIRLADHVDQAHIIITS